MKRSDGWWARLFRQGNGGRKPVGAPVELGEATRAFDERRYGDAEKTLRRALRQAESRGSDHPSVATALNNLAEIYRAQAKYDEALPLYRRAIETVERLHGPHDPSLARSLNSLALIYRAQGMYEEAEPLCRRALAILEKKSATDDPRLAPSLNNLLAVYLAQGRYGDALPLYRRSVAIKEKVLGPHHPELASSLGNYAALLRRMKEEKEAAACEARAETILRVTGARRPGMAGY